MMYVRDTDMNMDMNVVANNITIQHLSLLYSLITFCQRLMLAIILQLNLQLIKKYFHFTTFFIIFIQFLIKFTTILFTIFSC